MDLFSLGSAVSPVVPAVCHWDVRNYGRKSYAPLKYYLLPLIFNIGILLLIFLMTYAAELLFFILIVELILLITYYFNSQFYFLFIYIFS